MEQIKVEYLDHHGSDSAVANSARVSFADFSKWNDVPEGYSLEREAKLIKYLADHKHMTPFRHVNISIRCKAPIFIARQLGKHQIGLSWNEVSRRYVDDKFEFYYPKDWRKRPEGGIKQGSGDASVEEINDIIQGGLQSPQNVYSDWVELSLEFYQSLIKSDIAPEMARMVLPQSMQTEWIWSGSLLAFAHVYNERIASGAQKEAQYFANELGKVIRPIAPIAWDALTGGKNAN